MKGNRLRISGCQITLTRYRKILALAVGKASLPMMRALTDSLAGFPEVNGILVVPKNQDVRGLDSRIRVFRAGHPIPDRDGLEAAVHISNALRSMKRNELLICLISGGSSAMLPSPPSGVSLWEERRLTRKLLMSKANIHEINAVRRHISTLKGGRLVEQCQASTILTLIISDVQGNNLPDIGSGMTTEDPSTYQDAVSVLKKHKLWRETPRGIRQHLTLGLRGQIPETPKPGDPHFKKVRNIVVADNMAACRGAKKALSEKGVRTSIISSAAGIEARRMGELLASWAVESKEPRPSLARDALLIGGETVVHVKGSGKGGRNHETVLWGTAEIEGLDGVVLAALGTDGVDGNCEAAGALADGKTAQRAKRKGVRPQHFLAQNDSYTYFRALADNIVTGPTGTNVGDLYLAVSIA